MAIDTLAYVKALEAAGVPREQAEAQVAALTQHVLADLATKGDIAALRTEMATKADIVELKYELSWRFFGLMLGIVGVMDGILFALLRLTR